MMHRIGKFTPTHTHTRTHIRIASNNSFVVIWLLGYNVIWSKLYASFQYNFSYIYLVIKYNWNKKCKIMI